MSGMVAALCTLTPKWCDRKWSAYVAYVWLSQAQATFGGTEPVGQ